MSGKLRDSKGRILPVNVYQRADGQYEYRYFDEAGVRRSVYSWKLHKKDKTPKGKKDKPCIDDLISQIKKIWLTVFRQLIVISLYTSCVQCILKPKTMFRKIHVLVIKQS